MKFHIILWAVGLLAVYIVVAADYSSPQRFEVDLVRRMDGVISPTFIYSTITLHNGTAVVVFDGDKLSSQIDALYILLANSSKYISEVILNKDGSSQISTYTAPYQLEKTDKKSVKYYLNNNSTWSGNATFSVPVMGDVTYAMAAKLTEGDPEFCSSYLCTYQLMNAGISLPDMFVLDLYSRIGIYW